MVAQRFCEFGRKAESVPRPMALHHPAVRVPQEAWLLMALPGLAMARMETIWFLC